jgi:hypothetical protein
MGPSSPQGVSAVAETIAEISAQGGAPIAGKTAPPQKKYTKAEMGKLRRQFFTQSQGTVTRCGHKFHPVNQPTTNCQDCWEAFFRVHEGIVSGIESIIQSFGIAKLIDARGAKFVKQYKRYAAIIEEEQRNAASIATQEETLGVSQ